MGTCEEDADHQDQQTEEQSNLEENNLMITGPPASRTVIDNLKKLLVQRQHSRESDTENKNAARSNSGSNSDAAFYSQFSTSTSDSDDSSDDYMIFQEISNQADNNNGSSTNHSNRRRHRRRRSYSSSSSSSPSPVARSRRKVTRVNVTLTTSIGDVSVDGVVKTASGSQKPQEIPSGRSRRIEGTKEHDSANSTSSHKDSSDEDNFPVTNIQGNKSLSSSAEAAGPVTAGRCPKLKSRRDRDRKRKRSELNYATHRPKILKSTEDRTSTTTVISHNEGNSTNASHENASAAGGRGDATVASVPNHTAATLTPAISENSTGNLIDGAAVTFSENASSSSHLANQNKDE